MTFLYNSTWEKFIDTINLFQYQSVGTMKTSHLLLLTMTWRPSAGVEIRVLFLNPLGVEELVSIIGNDLVVTDSQRQH